MQDDLKAVPEGGLQPLTDEESEILERLEDADDIMPHCHQALRR
jgi:hypothetical protein